jgi:hypothetical protein
MRFFTAFGAGSWSLTSYTPLIFIVAAVAYYSLLPQLLGFISFQTNFYFFFSFLKEIRSDVFTVEFNFFRKFGDDLGYDELLLGNDWLLGLLKKLIDLKKLLVNIFFKHNFLQVFIHKLHT